MATRLRRSFPDSPGLTRRRAGKGFTYLDLQQRRITDEETLHRIRALAIPPRWRDVWICPYPNGHIQAVGTDDASRRQYLYHAAWHEVRGAEKFRRAQGLGCCLPTIRSRLSHEMGERGLTQDKVLACAVRLLDLGAFRIGSEQYVRQNSSYGLATIRREHVSVTRHGVVFDFPAKAGQRGEVTVTDPFVRRTVMQLVRRKDDSPELLAWWDSHDRRWVDVTSLDINLRLKSMAPCELTAKDFRTWHGSVLMAMELARRIDSEGELTKRHISASYRHVADELGNTPAVARQSYVDPRVLDLAERGYTISPTHPSAHDLVPTKASNQLHALLGSALD